MSPAPVADVTDTARWVAYFRAVESERPDALFQDRHARRLAGARGQAIAERLPRGPLSWSIAIRTKVFDELILEAVQAHGVRTVVRSHGAHGAPVARDTAARSRAKPPTDVAYCSIRLFCSTSARLSVQNEQLAP